ncbi:helix-turn-helix domain-containing protein [Streptococcus sp. E29BA]|uniref:helix-turn-helix domain-containing protein n=1 Tax=Streptococcus sp. E29BA TaxID=3278716 RepID=UPI00359D9A78
MNKFAEQLKDFRHQKGLSQDDLANQLHLSRQAISRWENGETAPDLDTLVKLSSIFEVTLDELATGIKPEPVIVEKVVEVEKEFKIPAEFHQHQGYGKMNVWDFLEDYWWVIIPILGYIGWILGK